MAMTRFTRLRSLVLPRLGQALRRLLSALAGGVPRPAPLLVPVPVRTDRRAPFAARRLPDWSHHRR
jgi:hypothetical protein